MGKKYFSSKGFTLIELMIVVVVIAILSAAGVVVFSNVQKNARDSRRKVDIKAIHDALEQHYLKFNSYTYPENLCVDTSYGAMGQCGGAGGSGDWDVNSDLRDVVRDGFIRVLSIDPINNSTYKYTYEPSNDVGGGKTYTLCAVLESGGNFCLNNVQ